MKASEIRDEGSLATWFKLRPVESALREAVVVAHRAAARDWLTWRARSKRATPNVATSRANLLLASYAQAQFEAINSGQASRRYKTAARETRDTVAHPPDGINEAPKMAASVVYAAASADDALARGLDDIEIYNSAALSITLDAINYCSGSIKRTQSDCELLAAGDAVHRMPLWLDIGFPVEWPEMRAEYAEYHEDWDFWINWYEALIHPDQRVRHDPELLFQVATQKNEFWQGSDADVNARIADFVIHWPSVEDLDSAKSLAQASFFDFVEFNRRLKMVGFPTDWEAFEDPDARKRFLSEVRDVRLGMQDWLDYAGDDPRSNAATPVRKSMTKLLDIFEKLESGRDVSLRRLVALGSDLRRFSLEARYRDSIGGELLKMLDECIDNFTHVSRANLGTVFASLEPLERLDIGGLDPDQLVASLKSALARLELVPDAEFPKLTPESQAELNDMIAELEDLSVVIKDANGAEQIASLRKQFSKIYGGTSATLARWIEKGSSVARSKKRFDEVLKILKGIDTIYKILKFLENIR
ncbi:MAG: hypothetical protein AAF748_11720 [Pseudomonadota bacterium]